MHGDDSDFPGARVTPDDPRYPALVRGFNQRWVGRPRFVQVVGDAQQVVAIVQRCVDEKLRLTVRSGGHCYEGWVSENDGVIVDVSSLRAAGWDAANGWYYLDSGCTNWDLYNQLYRQYGVTLPAGSCYSVGAGGHICGGGYGLLSRLHGLTVDWLYGVEVVCVDEDGRARPVRATRDSTDAREADLLWGHTGGEPSSSGTRAMSFITGSRSSCREGPASGVAAEWRSGGLDVLLRASRRT